MVGFFIDRPIFASAIAVIMVLAGALSYFLLPVSQFPEITPPQVVVSAVYPGASAQTVADTVTTPLEQQINGVEGMIYMSSSSSNDGSSNITVTFEVGYPLNIAAVDVQNRVSQAESSLPAIVNQAGVTIKKQNPNFVLIVNLVSPDKSVDPVTLSNYAFLQVLDPLKRVPGVGDVRIFGERRYSMRIWLDPDKLAALGITATDVQAAVSEQNVQVAAGKIGQSPSPIRSNSATSLCAPILPPAPWCGCAMSRASSSARCNMPPAASSAKNPRWCLRSTKCPAQTRSSCSKASRAKWRSSPSVSRAASLTQCITTQRGSSRRRCAMWC